jgi:hypothetical protein
MLNLSESIILLLNQPIFEITGSVSHTTNPAVGISDGVRSGDDVAVALLLTGLGVAGDGVSHGVAEVVLWVRVAHFSLNFLNHCSDGRGGLRNKFLI